MAKLNRPNGKLFGSSATNIGVFGSGQTGETPTTSTNPDAINTLGTHWEDGWNGAVVSQAPYTAPFVEDMNAVNYVNSYNGAYLLQQGIPEYSKNADYYVDSVCTYNGKIYMCILDNPAVNPDPDDPDPDAPPINYPLTDTTHWNERVELPDMNDNEVLVGSIGGTGVATDTLNQGDIVASSGGLNIKTGVIVNTDVKSDAAIEESKLALDHSTDSLNTAISGKAISNLADTTITTPVGDGDVLLYDDNSSKWVNSDSLTNHLNDTNNPHQTSMSNLDDANVNDRQTLADGDVMVYDLANTDWVNSPSLKNHLSDTNNPHTTTLANLDDTTITTPQDGDAIIYDNNSSKWINTPLPGGAISTLSDTTITTPIADKSLVQYNLGTGKWVNVSVPVPTLWVTSTSYSIGDFVFYGGRTYECKVAHTSSSVFESDFYTGKWDDGNIAGTIIHNLAFGKTPPYHYFDVTGSSAGAEISQTTYANLYAVIGDTYNTCYNYSSGSQYSAPASGNFRLPDFRNTFFKNSGSSTWGAGHNAQHKHTTALDTATSLSHYHHYMKQNAGESDLVVLTGAVPGGYWHWNSKPTNTSVDTNFHYFNFTAGKEATSDRTTSSSIAVPALNMQNQGSGTTPEPNNYGARIFIKY